VLDPGHGGRDPGATGPRGTHEKNITLAIGLDVRRDLQKIPGLKIDMTRTRDVYPTLSQRLYLARKVKADVFVSIHADAFRNRAARGATVFALSRGRATSEAARWIAERENKSELLGGVDLADKSYTLRSVLVDLSQTATIGSSLKLGLDVVDNLRQITKMHSSRVEQASLYVLTSPDIPAILVETGFISNPTEERLLNTRSHQEKIAKAIAEGIKRFLIDSPIQDTVFTERMFGGKYIVKTGDTLSEIADKYGVSISQLRQVNAINNNTLFIGQVIRIPAKDH
jgi:N-acetylmuramoyl-L-alanine amidase